MNAEPGASDATYEPTARSRRQGRFPRAFPSLVGLASWAIAARHIGIGLAFVIGVVAAVATWLLLRLVIAHRLRGLQKRAQRVGCSLIADVTYDVDSLGGPRDLNHRSGGEIASGGGEHPPAASGLLEGSATWWRVSPNPSKHRPNLHRYEMQWDAVESAEVLTLRGRKVSVLFIETRDGARYRFQVYAGPERVREMLRVARVAEWKAAEAPDLKVSDPVRTRDGREGTIVALVPREREPGHTEVFVRFGTPEVESWDSSEVTLVNRSERDPRQ